MGIRKALVVWVLASGFSAATALPAVGQFVMGQYEDEAPFRTWNTFAFSSAASLGRGETSFSLAADCSVALANPALLLTLPKLSLTLNGSLSRASFFKYSVVNTGVLKTSQNPTLGLYALDFGGISARFGVWAAALLVSAVENYDRPEIRVEESFRGSPYYRLTVRQSGILRTIHLSLARSLGSRWALGIGLNYFVGGAEKEVTESYLAEGITISDRKTFDFTGFNLNGGLTARLSDRWTAGFVFRAPFQKTAKGHSLVNYSAPKGGTDISIIASSEDGFQLPPVLGAGLSYRMAPDFRLTADIAWHGWARYEAESFGEPQEREFRNIFKFGAGAEYGRSLTLFKKRAMVPLRLGLVVDSQPMKNPKSVYYSLTLGAGIHWDFLCLDIGYLTGRETGSGNSLTGQRLAVSLTFRH